MVTEGTEIHKKDKKKSYDIEGRSNDMKFFSLITNKNISPHFY